MENKCGYVYVQCFRRVSCNWYIEVCLYGEHTLDTSLNWLYLLSDDGVLSRSNTLYTKVSGSQEGGSDGGAYARSPRELVLIVVSLLICDGI